LPGETLLQDFFPPKTGLAGEASFALVPACAESYPIPAHLSPIRPSAAPGVCGPAVILPHFAAHYRAKQQLALGYNRLIALVFLESTAKG
jgi:hypothetical protein